MPTLQLELMKDSHVALNGTLKARVVVTVDDEQKLIEKVNLENARACKQLANRLSQMFGVDTAEASTQLATLSVRAAALAAQRQKHREEDAPEKRVADVAYAFLKAQLPKWHRKRSTVFLEKVGAEVKLPDAWKLASPQMIDALADTQEGYDAKTQEDGTAPYAKLLSLWKDACAMAGAWVCADVPELEDADADPSVNSDELRAAIVAWLLKDRQFRQDTGIPAVLTFYGWAYGVEPEAGWQQCYTAAVFARRDPDDPLPHIAVKGEILVQELRYSSNRRLSADLKDAKLAETDRTVRIGPRVYRVWLLTPKVFDAITAPTEEESA